MQNITINSNEMNWHSRSAQIYAIYEEHQDHITSLGLTRDGTLASVSKDKTLRLWDTVKNEQIDIVSLTSTNVTGVVGTPDGKLTICLDNVVKCYNPDKQEIDRTLQGHVKNIYCICLTPDGNILSSGEDMVIKYWNVRQNLLVKSYYGHDDIVRQLKMLSDQKKFVSCSDDKSVKIWDINSGQIVQGFDHSESVYSIVQTSDVQIAAGLVDGTLKLWDRKKDDLIFDIQAHDGAINCITMLVDGYMATGSRDKLIKIWNTKNGLLMNTLIGHQEAIRDFQVLQSGNLASCGEDNLIIIWSGLQLEVLISFIGHTKPIWSVCGLPGARFGSAGEDRMTKLWDYTQGSQSINTIQGHKDQVRAIIYNNFTNQIITGCMDKQIRIYNADNYEMLNQFQAHEAGVRSLSLTEYGDIISGGEEKLIKVWQSTDLSLIMTIDGLDDYARVICGLSENRICTGFRDTSFHVWKNGVTEQILNGHRLPIWSICEVQKGNFVATGSSDCSIRVWNLKQQKQEQVLQGHSGTVFALIMLNQMLLISSGEDCTLRVWDWEYNYCVRILKQHSFCITGLALTYKQKESEGKMVDVLHDPLIGSGSWDKTVKCWHIKRVKLNKTQRTNYQPEQPEIPESNQ